MALKPTATMTQAARPTIETNTRMKFHSPWRMKPRKRKIRRTRPVRRKLKQSVNHLIPRQGKAYYYFLRSFSVRVGRPAKTDLRVIMESLKTMKRPPMTLRLRRKKFKSKIRPYPNPWMTTTPRRPATAYSVNLFIMTASEPVNII